MHNIPESQPRRFATRPAFLSLSAAALIALAPLAAEAHDKHHHHRHKGGEYKEKYWDGACKVERNGSAMATTAKSANAVTTMLMATRRNPWRYR